MIEISPKISPKIYPKIPLITNIYTVYCIGKTVDTYKYSYMHPWGRREINVK